MTDAASHSSPASPHDPREHELVLVKNGQRYVFRCQEGREAQLMAQLAEVARDPNVDLDWFDAALLSHQMGRRLQRRLDRWGSKAG